MADKYYIFDKDFETQDEETPSLLIVYYDEEVNETITALVVMKDKPNFEQTAETLVNLLNSGAIELGID